MTLARTVGAAPAPCPLTPYEEILYGLCADILGLDVVLGRQNFAELGGDAETGARLAAAVRSSLRSEVSVEDLLRAPTLASVARRLAPSGPPPADRTEDGGANGPRLVLRRPEPEGMADFLELPTDHPRRDGVPRHAGTVAIAIDAGLHTRLAGLARARGVTFLMVLQAALAATLTRLGCGDDVPIGSCGQARTDTTEEDPGDPAGLLVLRVDTTGNPAFTELLAQVRERSLRAFAQRDVPFDRPADEAGAARSAAPHPSFQVLVDLRRGSSSGSGSERFGPRWGSEARDARCDLAFELREHLGPDHVPVSLSGELTYATGLFDVETAQWLVRRWVSVLAQVADRQDVPLADLDILDSGEAGRLIEEGNGASRPHVADHLMHELFEEQAASLPDRTALMHGEDRLSYAELNARANRLAHALTDRGVGPECLVALGMSRSIDLVTSILAVLKAGAAYCTVDPSLPPERVRSMLDEADPVLLVTVDAWRSRFLDGEPVRSLVLDDGAVREELRSRPVHNPTDADRTLPLRSDNLAYMFYTSGSTGRPKGVAVPHTGVSSLASTVRETFGLGPHCRVLQFASFMFDMSVWDQCMSLFNGCTMVLVEDDRRVGPDLVDLITEFDITHLTLPPAALASIPEDWELPPDLVLITGGEALSVEDFRRWSDHATVYNTYGPTETTVVATQWSGAPDSVRVTVPIGGPIHNAAVHVLDERLRPVPHGVVGELYISGPGVARGYTARPDLTAERFVADPFGRPGSRMYRSGDRVRRRRDGALEFFGRKDGQVKIRGFRVELGEVEATVLKHPQLRQCVVTLREDRPGDKRLVAYAVTGSPSVDAQELRRYLRSRLPEYMIPAAIVFLEALPVAANGKVNRRALPKPELTGSLAARTGVRA